MNRLKIPRLSLTALQRASILFTLEFVFMFMSLFVARVLHRFKVVPPFLSAVSSLAEVLSTKNATSGIKPFF
jgi:hypothetical protein